MDECGTLLGAGDNIEDMILKVQARIENSNAKFSIFNIIHVPRRILMCTNLPENMHLNLTSFAKKSDDG